MSTPKLEGTYKVTHKNLTDRAVEKALSEFVVITEPIEPLEAHDFTPAVGNFGDGWLTKHAQDLAKVAIAFGGFDAGELVLAITKLQGKRSGKANVATVEKALQMVYDSHLTSEELEARAKTHEAFIARLRENH